MLAIRFAHGFIRSCNLVDCFTQQLARTHDAFQSRTPRNVKQPVISTDCVRRWLRGPLFGTICITIPSDGERTVDHRLGYAVDCDVIGLLRWRPSELNGHWPILCASDLNLRLAVASIEQRGGCSDAMTGISETIEQRLHGFWSVAAGESDKFGLAHGLKRLLKRALDRVCCRIFRPAAWISAEACLKASHLACSSS